MSGGGSKPRGGKMGTAIRAASVSPEAIANADAELSEMVAKLKNIRQKMADAVKSYQASEKAVSLLEMELAKCQQEVMINNSNYSCSIWIIHMLITLLWDRLTV